MKYHFVRTFAILLCLTIVASGASAEKRDPEFDKDGNPTHEFTVERLVDRPVGKYLEVNFEQFVLHRSVSGTRAPWKTRIRKWFNRDTDHEISLFVLVATFDSKETFHKLKHESPLRVPLMMPEERPEEHNWFVPSFKIAELKKEYSGVDVAYWLGYNGSVEDGKPQSLTTFEPIGEASIGMVAGRPGLLSLAVKNQKYVLVEVLAYEESGYTDTRKVQKLIGKQVKDAKKDGLKTLGAAVWELAKGDTVESATKVIKPAVVLTAGSVANWQIERYLDRQEIFDVEYSFVTPRATEQIPTLFKRVWNGSDSFEMQLTVTGRD